MGLRALAAPVALMALAIAPAGDGAWALAKTGSGNVGSKSMPGGNTPSGTVPAPSRNVTVSWTASQFASGQNVPGYVVKRYNAVTNVLQTTLANCSGTVVGTSCTENSVPAGTWKYTVTPAAGSWRGAESAQSANVLVL